MPDPTNDLGNYLRLRREQLRPEDVDLPSNGRRRTPGLRREEVATLAGVSIDYLVRLEQGRDRNPSAAVVASLAKALRLNRDEHKHLMKLAACASAPEMCPAAGVADDVSASMRLLIDRLHPTPAVVVGPWFQVLAHNEAWTMVVRGFGLFDDPTPNLARFTFLDPRAHTVFPQWAELADEQVAVLRDAAIRCHDEDRLAGLLQELQAVPAFAERWQAHNVFSPRQGVTLVRHPDAGELRLHVETMLSADDSGQRLISWLPADDATDEALHRLQAAPLRVVGSF